MHLFSCNCSCHKIFKSSLDIGYGIDHTCDVCCYMDYKHINPKLSKKKDINENKNTNENNKNIDKLKQNSKL